MRCLVARINVAPFCNNESSSSTSRLSKHVHAEFDILNHQLRIEGNEDVPVDSVD